MHSVHHYGASSAPTLTLQADRVRRRIAASDAVASLVAELCFGPPRDATSWVWPTPSSSSLGSTAHGR